MTRLGNYYANMPDDELERRVHQVVGAMYGMGKGLYRGVRHVVRRCRGPKCNKPNTRYGAHYSGGRPIQWGLPGAKTAAEEKRFDPAYAHVMSIAQFKRNKAKHLAAARASVGGQNKHAGFKQNNAALNKHARPVAQGVAAVLRNGPAALNSASWKPRSTRGLGANVLSAWTRTFENGSRGTISIAAANRGQHAVVTGVLKSPSGHDVMRVSAAHSPSTGHTSDVWIQKGHELLELDPQLRRLLSV